MTIRLDRLGFGLFLALGLTIGPALAAADHCHHQPTCCCTAPSEQRESRGCPQQTLASECAMDCADGYAGVGRFEASPLRITTAPLRKPLAAVPTASLHQNVRVIPLRELRAQGSPSIYRPPKRYLLACTFRL